MHENIHFILAVAQIISADIPTKYIDVERDFLVNFVLVFKKRRNVIVNPRNQNFSICISETIQNIDQIREGFMPAKCKYS